LTKSEFEEDLIGYAVRLCENRIAAYREAPHDAEEHANIEQSVLAGGYAYRQVAELVQNAADAIMEAPLPEETGRIVVTTDHFGLWAANSGASLDRAGVRALLNSNASGKRAGQIGRFGLGFKSLLKLGGRIAVLSRSVSLLFDPAACRSQVRSLLGLPKSAPAPGLRLAKSVTWADAQLDTPGAENFSWATTTVFAELVTPGAREAVVEEMRRFPSEFLLFLPTDIDLFLNADGFERHLRRRTEPDGIMIIEDLAADEARPPQRWRVFQTMVNVNGAAALEDATSVHARDAVPLIWAVPIGTGPVAAGRFFAFFPTSTETRTLGILNAPWKLNSDRTALIPGAWNAALMEAAADFIVSQMPQLSRDEDPGAILDAYPRELATQNEPAAPLVAALWDRLVKSALLPNCDRELVEPTGLLRPPVDSVELGTAWSRLATPESCSIHLHPSCTISTARVSRLSQLSERFGSRGGSLSKGPALRRSEAIVWLEAAATTDPESACDVLMLAEQYAASVPEYVWDSIRDRVRLLLSADLELIPAAETTLSPGIEPPLRALHPVLLASPQAARVLASRFHLRANSETNWERLLDARIAKAGSDDEWTDVWLLLRRMPWEVTEAIIDTKTLKVRCLSGWANAEECLRPGKLLGQADVDNSSDEMKDYLRARLLDLTWHFSDDAILTILGIVEEPEGIWDRVQIFQTDIESPAGLWLRKWQREWVSRYHTALQHRPDPSLLEASPFYMPRYWDLLLFTAGAAKWRLCQYLLSAVSTAKDSELKSVSFRHSSRPNVWTSKDYPHPLWSLFLEHGEVAVAGFRIGVSHLLTSDVGERAQLLPSLANNSEAFRRLVRTAGEFSAPSAPNMWKVWLKLASGERQDAANLSALWEAAGRAGFVPLQVCSEDGPIDLTEAIVTISARDGEAARSAGHPCITLSPEVVELWISKGARPLDSVLSLEWENTDAGDEAVLLSEVEPTLGEVLDQRTISIASVQFVASLHQRLNTSRELVDWGIHDGQLFVSEPEYLSKAWPARVRLLVEAARTLGWITQANAEERVLRSGVAARRRTVSDGEDIAERLLRAVGNFEIILGLFEPDVQEELRGEPSKAARVALTLLGPSVLVEPTVREAMVQNGLAPPDRWGGEAAADFVSALGFPSEFAIAPSRRRDPELVVSGPLPLKPLHKYQESVVTSLDLLLAGTDGTRRRAVISLPTGAGKTRVAAQTAVTRTLGPESENRLVVWIAQTDELCEQAVQCFRELWANLGDKATSLRIIRFWGGQTNPQPSARDEPTVVVASIQTLISRMNVPGIEWVSQPGLVIIDECHHALTPAYTNIFRWLNGATSAQTEPPVLGLSATPFRGRSNDETIQLARRFDGRLIPIEQSGLFDELQAMGVLARFKYTRLDVLGKFSLTNEEEKYFEKFKTFPETALDRLGENRERNDMIVEAIRDAEEQSALVFGTSVAHTRRLAARLNILGIPAAAVSGETDRSSRRWFISAFQRGDVRVLCNHSALTTGFDAPATDLIVIARPVFSPSLYMQMVGRGLRGPLNGGKPFCRILTVQDNLDRHSENLAHHYFERFYL
jgi:superfamily II DNA or RNA helicase